MDNKAFFETYLNKVYEKYFALIKQNTILETNLHFANERIKELENEINKSKPVKTKQSDY